MITIREGCEGGELNFIEALVIFGTISSKPHRFESFFKDMIAQNQIPQIFRLSQKQDINYPICHTDQIYSLYLYRYSH